MEEVGSSGEGARVQEMARTAAEVVKDLEGASKQQWRGRECSGGGVNCCGGGGRAAAEEVAEGAVKLVPYERWGTVRGRVASV